MWFIEICLWWFVFSLIVFRFSLFVVFICFVVNNSILVCMCWLFLRLILMCLFMFLIFLIVEFRCRLILFLWILWVNLVISLLLMKLRKLLCGLIRVMFMFSVENIVVYFMLMMFVFIMINECGICVIFRNLLLFIMVVLLNGIVFGWKVLVFVEIRNFLFVICVVLLFLIVILILFGLIKFVILFSVFIWLWLNWCFSMLIL